MSVVTKPLQDKAFIKSWKLIQSLVVENSDDSTIITLQECVMQILSRFIEWD